MNRIESRALAGEEIPLVTIEIAQEEVITVIKERHPDWVQADGECPLALIYEYQLADPEQSPEKAEGEAAA